MSNFSHPEIVQEGIKAFVFHPEENLVLVLRRAKTGEWTLPGGKYEEPDKSLEVAFDRELSEETQLERDRNTALELVGVHPFSVQRENGTLVVHRFITLTRALSSKVQLNKEHDRYFWIELSMLGSLALESTLVETLPMLLDADGKLPLQSRLLI